MTTNQEARQISVRASTSTTYDHNSDWNALFTAAGIAAGPWNNRFIAWVNAQLSSSYSNINEAKRAIAAAQGVTRWNDVSTISLFNVFVDSVAGSDLNSGTSSSQAVQTLSKAVTLINAYGNGCRVSLKGGSTWREKFNPTVSNIYVAWDGTSTPPVITGFDVITSWTLDSTFTNCYYKDITHDATGTLRTIVLENGLILNRVASASAANSASGSFYAADASAGNPMRVYINVGGNPNSNGKTYEATTRTACVLLGNGATLTGVVARGAMNNNGPIEVGTNSTVSRCVAAFGTKHNFFLGSGAATDVVLYGNDATTASEPSTTMFVAFQNNATGLSASLTRMFATPTKPLSTIVYSHSNNDPADQYASITLDQCAFNFANAAGAGITAGAATITATNTVSFGASANVLFAGYASSSASFTRCLSLVTIDEENKNISSGSVTYTQCGLSRNLAGGSKRIIGVLDGSSVTVTNCSIDGPIAYYGDAVGWQSGTTGSLNFNWNVISANNCVNIPTGTATYTANNNTFDGDDIGPFSTFKAAGGFNLSTNMAGWRTASGQDANSTGITSGPFTGTTANGDFTVSGHLAGSGITEYWNFNTRSVTSGVPTRFPTIPATYAEAITYITSPTTWNFYP